MIEPSWNKKRKEPEESQNWSAYVARDQLNPDNFEIFMVNDEGCEETRAKVAACWAATEAIDLLYLPMGSYPVDDKYTYEYQATPVGMPIEATVNVPPKKQSKWILNTATKWELFAAILEINGLSFNRPHMEVLDYEGE